MYDGTCNTMNSSTRIGVVGAGQNNKLSGFITADSKILMFIFSIQLIEFYIINSIGNVVKHILNVYIQSVIIEVVEFTVGDGLLGFCDQTFIKTCPVLDGYEV